MQGELRKEDESRHLRNQKKAQDRDGECGRDRKVVEGEKRAGKKEMKHTANAHPLF